VAVLDATLQELLAKGYGGLSVDGVAGRSGVSRATLYRRWGGRDGLVLDAVGWFGVSHADVPDSGNFDEDLWRWARSVRSLLTDPATAALVRAVLLADSQGAHDVRQRFWRSRLQRARAIVERAIDRGEIPDDTDVEEVVRHVGAPLYYRFLVLGEPVTIHAADLAAAVTTSAVHQGVFGSERSVGAAGRRTEPHPHGLQVDRRHRGARPPQQA
jgi:AcrR family transcriptional regulator